MTNESWSTMENPSRQVQIALSKLFVLMLVMAYVPFLHELGVDWPYAVGFTTTITVVAARAAVLLHLERRVA